MLKVTIELWPFGDEKKKRLIAEGIIANDGTGNRDIGNYTYKLLGDNGSDSIGRVKNYPRRKGVWFLLHEVLRSFCAQTQKASVLEDKPLGDKHGPEASCHNAGTKVPKRIS